LELDDRLLGFEAFLEKLLPLRSLSCGPFDGTFDLSDFLEPFGFTGCIAPRSDG
jgi:hypothetical protein